MKKPTVYLDTSVISAYWYVGRNVAALARRIETREWWDEERDHFAICASVFTELELLGDSRGSQSACAWSCACRLCP